MMDSGEDQISSVHLFSIRKHPHCEYVFTCLLQRPRGSFSQFFAYLKDKMGIKFYIYEFSVYKTDF